MKLMWAFLGSGRTLKEGEGTVLTEKLWLGQKMGKMVLEVELIAAV